MESQHDENGGHDDPRGAEPPADDHESGDADSEGPQGNPEVDEESLQHRQQESGDS